MKILELRECFDILLHHVEVVHGVKELAIESCDYYWSVSPAQWLSMDAKPELVVGSLVDDVNELKKLISNPDRASAVDIDRTASLLRFLSDQISAASSEAS